MVLWGGLLSKPPNHFIIHINLGFTVVLNDHLGAKLPMSNILNPFWVKGYRLVDMHTCFDKSSRSSTVLASALLCNIIFSAFSIPRRITPPISQIRPKCVPVFALLPILSPSFAGLMCSSLLFPTSVFYKSLLLHATFHSRLPPHWSFSLTKL